MTQYSDLARLGLDPRGSSSADVPEADAGRQYLWLARQFGAGALQREFGNLGQPLQNYDGGLPGESQWFRNLTPNMRRNYGHGWPGSPVPQPPTMQPDSRTPTLDPNRMRRSPRLHQLDGI
jgi:hypothetical protein